MRRLAWLLAWIMVGCVECAADAQAPITATIAPEKPPYVLRLGVLDSLPRALMAADWTDTVYQHERAYCATKYDRLTSVDPTNPRYTVILYWIRAVERAPEFQSSPEGVSFRCPLQAIPIHSHAPTTCTLAIQGRQECVYGGLNAWQCQPSSGDLQYLEFNRMTVGVIQCGRDAFRFYFLEERNP